MKKKRRFGYYLYAIVILLLTVANISLAILLLTHVQKIQVSGTRLSTEEEIKAWVTSDPKTVNSLYTVLKYKFGDKELPIYLEDIAVSLNAPWELQVDVDEKDIIACVKYKNNYVQFDKEGLVLQISAEQPADIPLIEGVPVRGAAQFELMTVQDENVFSYVSNIISEVEKSGLKPNRIAWKDGSINLYFEEVCVELGKSNYGIKLAELPPILEKVEGKKGVLRMEYFTQPGDKISFEEDK